MEHPSFLYGTAWKEERTSSLTLLALQHGFRGIDTANQRKHYFERAVGEGILESGIPRSELWLQSKFTYVRGQDHRLPYDPGASLPTQVRQSIESTLENLQTTYIDSYLLHGPWAREGWTAQDRDVWRTMEEAYERGVLKKIGVSNCSLEQVSALLQEARVPPSFVQNRCYARTAWDKDIREFCGNHNIVYQGFSLLTANRNIFQHPYMQELCNRYQKTGPQIVFRFALAVGMLPLTGTSNAKHMQQDRNIFDFTLSNEECRRLEHIAVRK
ncbi:MAG: aldo/keto reductase [Myxococcota bacterium]|nr:aldo/keto reductase [Myxococcota bacterium]